MIRNKIRVFAELCAVLMLLPTFVIFALNDNGDGFDPTSAQHFGLINDTLEFTPDELAMMRQNGFVVTDRLAFTEFKLGYAYIYWRDLPVLVTTDSILHSIHQTYDEMLKELEITILSTKLDSLLTQTLGQVQRDAQANTDPRLDAYYADLELYLRVPHTLLTSTSLNDALARAPDAGPYLELIQHAGGVAPVDLFGSSRDIDFSQFQPRGHYTKSSELRQYFLAVMWLTQIDFRMVEYDAYGNPHLNIGQVVSAKLLRDAIDASGQRANWNEIDALLTAFIGANDNITLESLDRFIADAGISTPGDFFYADYALLALLTTGDYGAQRITGQALYVEPDNPDALSRPVSFTLMGQRFTVGSYVMSNLVYDRVASRAYPSPLDVMAVMGNERALTHLDDELSQYGYRGALDALHAEVNGYGPDFWESSIYNRWLNIMRTLNENTTDAAYPQAMQTSAWADKTLHTQLASWTQLRHDNSLYVKQSYAVSALCEFPTGYVEPYPAFYAAIGEYARFGRALFVGLDTSGYAEEALTFHQTALIYYENLESVAAQLQTLAEKELRLEPFTPEEELFLKSVMVRQDDGTIMVGCMPVTVAQWGGWYIDLLPWGDNTPELIADVHTNLNQQDPRLMPPGVLHVATGDAVVMAMIVDTDEGQTMYVGPAFTYYEHLEAGYPPRRLDDRAWDSLYHSEDEHPTPPDWTSSFRLPTAEEPEYLIVPLH